MFELVYGELEVVRKKRGKEIFLIFVIVFFGFRY